MFDRSVLLCSVPGDHRRRFADPAELVVHAELEDVILDPGVNLADDTLCRGQGVQEPVGPEVDVEEFALDRPAVADRVFGAGTDRPTADPAAGDRGAVEANRIAGQPSALLDARPG